MWRSLIAHLKVAADGCKAIGVRVSVAEVPCPVKGESGCRVTCAGGFPALRLAYCDVLYTQGEAIIRVLSGTEDEDFRLRLCVTEGSKVGLWRDGARKPMDAEEAAQAVMEPLVSVVRGER